MPVELAVIGVVLVACIFYRLGHHQGERQGEQQWRALAEALWRERARASSHEEER